MGSGRSDADGNDGLKDAEGKGKVWEPGHDWKRTDYVTPEEIVADLYGRPVDHIVFKGQGRG